MRSEPSGAPGGDVRFPLGVIAGDEQTGDVDEPYHDDERYRAVVARDSRFDGWFVTAVQTTGIYCRPSCPAITPQRRNVSFYPTAAAAQQKGFRACKRCRPDASPGSPEWNVRADLAGRAMRLIADGVVDRDGVAGLARRLGYSERHLTRVITAELGAGPLALARAQRAQTARVLLEHSDLAIGEVAFAAGFGSVRQFNDTVREVFAVPPMALRAARRSAQPATGEIVLRLAHRQPLDSISLFDFLAVRAVAGVEDATSDRYRRTLRLPHGAGSVDLRPAPTGEAAIICTLRVDAVADLPVAVQRCRRLLDLDADPVAIDAHLGADQLLEPLVRAHPGLRSPGAVDGVEVLVRALVGQQVSVASARTLLGRIVELVGDQSSYGPLFPTADALAALDPTRLPLPAARARALVEACGAVADGRVDIDIGSDRFDAGERLTALRGVGTWTAAYVAMRALGDPDVFLPSDLVARRTMARLTGDGRLDAVARRADTWRPWRSYALHHLWRASMPVTRPRRTGPLMKGSSHVC